jgi:protein-tyrosine phosphatase
MASQIIEGLYISDSGYARSATGFAFINCLINDDKLDGKYLHCPSSDSSSFPISKYFKKSSAFIKECLEEKLSVIVYCSYGASRSPIIFCIFL